MLLQLLIFAVIAVAAGKNFTAEEVKKQLIKHGVPNNKIPMWVCIANKTSNNDGSRKNIIKFDLFGITEGVCNDNCNLKKCPAIMMDDDIQGDIKCALIWYEVWNIPQIGQQGFVASGIMYEKCKKEQKLLKNASSRVSLNVAALLLCALGLITFN